MAWIAPELLRSYSPTPQGTQPGDIFSFGMILYLLVFERPPYQGEDIQGEFIQLYVH